MPLVRLDARGLDAAETRRLLPDPLAGPGRGSVARPGTTDGDGDDGGGGDRGDDRDGGDEGFASKVSAILERVRGEGDAALLDLTRRLDGVALTSVSLTPEQISASSAEVLSRLIESLEVAWRRLLAYHRHQAGTRPEVFDDGVVSIRELVRPVARAGLYAPGGRALYPSSVLMCAAPARVAGVDEMALCVPPGPDGKVAPAVLAAARLCGISEIHPIGGAQAIAAMAYGTESIASVDVVVGPGNRWVAEAKRQVAGTVGVAAAFAGPSEVVVVADGSAPASWAAMDLVVQAEHGPAGLAFLVTWVEDLVADVSDRVDRMVEASVRREELVSTIASGGYAVLVDGPQQAMEVANAIAPEHLELQVTGAPDLAEAVRCAGAVFVGPFAPASVGDYVAGTNHVLPTARSARFSSALRVDDFLTHVEVVSLDRKGLESLAPHVSEIATAEGLDAHAESVRLRLDGSDTCGGPLLCEAHEPRTSGAGAPVVVDLPPVRSDLAAMTGYHSAQVEAAVRLNTNESPFPPPAAWRKALEREIQRIEFNRYPDRAATRLREAVARHEAVGADRVFCANGSNEVLQSLLLAYGGPSRNVCVFEPTYALHRHIATVTGTAVHTGWREQDHTLAERTARTTIASSSPVITFLCSPNNPTGLAEPEKLLLAVLQMAPGLVVVDEAYGQFSERSALDLVRTRVPGSDRLVVVRTFSKTWSMASSRLGYMVASPEVVRACEMVVLPYHLDAVSQAAGVLALEFESEMRDRVRAVIAERRRLFDALGSLEVEVWPSDANFILFRPLRRDARRVWSELLDEEVLIRDCSGWPGLTGCLRVTVGTPVENTRFLAALEKSLRSESVAG